MSKVQAEKIGKLVALADSPNENEAQAAAEKAVELIRNMDLELLATLAKQRAKLLADIRAEFERLWQRNTRANSGTANLLQRASLLLWHYEKVDALPSVIQLLRQEGDR